MMSMFESSKTEDTILDFWKKNDIYKKLLKKNSEGEIFNFTDGPPFVSSSSLHYGHIHVGFLKSTIHFYKSMNGYNYLNKIGYDCHGLPIEMVANRLLNIKYNDEIEKFGINKYNSKCKDIINSYSGEWRYVFEKMGRWVDFDNEYKTMDLNFMESVWWIFKELFKKNLIYKGYRVMALSTECETTLSNSEAGSNYKIKTDISVYVKFKLKKSNSFVIVWTTTPWTLFGNLALCVGSNIIYVKLKDTKTEEIYIIAKSLIQNIYSNDKDYDILDEFNGSVLENIEYEPIFPTFSKERVFKILNDDFVKTDSGSGIVHLAPNFGEVDFDVCIKNNIVNNINVIEYCYIDNSGRFTSLITEYTGQYYIDVNKKIITKLEETGNLIKKEQYSHQYPFCYRTDTPLIYKTVSSVFVKVTQLKNELIENNKKVNWTPKHIGSGRFHNWLDSVKDWGISRSRYFGTPIPMWINDDGKEMLIIGSIDELIEKANLKDRPTDIHREFIDNIEIPSPSGNGMLHRIPDVFDCWFESGSVPLAQLHYPFENKDVIDNREYLSEFICEGVDQTRGWFYNLMVLSTALFNKPAFKNVICSGLICADDGKKLSKRLGNYTQPNEIFNKYSSDALRAYLGQSPATKASSFKFKEADISLISKCYYQLYNGFKFFHEMNTMYVKKFGQSFNTNAYTNSNNIMDKWILSHLGTMLKNINLAMNDYKVYKVYPLIMNFIEDLTNWYIKFNRNRIKGKGVSNDQEIALATLHKILRLFCKISAPFMPFLTELIYQSLLKIKSGHQSIHLCNYPQIDKFPKNQDIEIVVKLLQSMCISIRNLRFKSENKNLYSVKTPIRKLIVYCDNEKLIANLKMFENYLRNETNVLKVEYSSQKGKVKYNIKPNHKKLGMKYKKLSKQIINKMKDAIIVDNKLIVNLEGQNYEILQSEYDVGVELVDKLGNNCYDAIVDNIVIVVDTTYTKKVEYLYLNRTIIREINQLRKEAKLHIYDKVNVYYQTDDNELLNIMKEYKSMIIEQTDSQIYLLTSEINETITQKSIDISGKKITIILAKN